MIHYQNLIFLLILIIAIIIVVISCYRDRSMVSQNECTVTEIPNLLTYQECDELINYCKTKGMTDSYVANYNNNTNGIHINTNFRTSKSSYIRRSELDISKKIAIRSQELSGIPMNHQEELQVSYYQTGGKFDAHYDAFPGNDLAYVNKMNRGAGQRRCTLLIYLNDDFKGGETEFVNLNIKIKPEKGKAILFWDTNDKQMILEKSKHRGNPVIDGEKWICTQWSHIYPFPAHH